MAQMFFMDESGHDHKTMPYEVRGGFSIHMRKLWSLVQDIRALELHCFGQRLIEFKGSKLLSKKKFEWASQDTEFPDDRRRDLVKKFLENKDKAKGEQYTAYGQACLRMAQGIVKLLVDMDVVVFAVSIPRQARRPANSRYQDFLRKDQVFLFERFYYFLEEKNEHGVIVMDETERIQDGRFVVQMEKYFSKTENGRKRAYLVVPTPLFVSSHTAIAVQAADLCIYAINWGFRLPNRGMDAETRPEIADMFGAGLSRLQYKKQDHGQGFETYGITYVPNPYKAGR